MFNSKISSTNCRYSSVKNSFYKTKASYRLLIFVFLLFFTGKLFSQISSTGKTFYMSFMEMETRTGFGGNPNPYPDTLLIFVTSEYDTKVVIDNPRLTGSSATYNIKKGVVNRISVDNVYYYPVGSEFGSTDNNSKKGLRLVANDPVNVYCMNLELNRSDGTFIMPYESIPNAPEFFVNSFPPNARIGSSNYGESEFVIIGMDNNLKVDITPTADTKGGKTAGTTFQITLQKGQVYQVQSKSADGTNNTDPAATSWSTTGAKKGDLSGTRIKVVNGCGKINVFSGARSSHVTRGNCGSGINGRDHLYTQVLPTKALGKDYVLMPFARQTGGYAYKVIAAYDTTDVYINGTFAERILKKGEWIYRHVTTAVPVCVKTSKPAYVPQYMKNGVCNGWANSDDGDPAIFISPDVNQRLLKTIVGTATTNNMKTHFVNILIDKTAKKAVKVNGTFLNSSVFTDISCGNYSFAQVSLANPSSNTIECDSGCIVVAYGTGPYESYAYSAGALFEDVEFDFKVTRKGKCPSEPVTLEAQYKASNVKGVKWKFGDGSPEEWGNKVVHTFSRIGTYYAVMKVVVPNSCGIDDTIVRSKIINVLPGPVLTLPDTIIQCTNTLKVDLSVPFSSKFLYVWDDSSKLRTRTVTKEGEAWIRVRDTSTNCIAKDSVMILRAELVHAGLSYDTLNRCYKENYFSLTDGSKYTNDVWKKSYWSLKDAYTNTTITSEEKRFSKKFDSLSTNALRYIVESKKGCRDTLDTTLVVYPYPVAKLSIPVPYFCQNGLAKFIDSSTSPLGISKSMWNFGDGAIDTSINRLTEHVFVNHDTFNIRLITETIYACRDTIDSLYVVYPQAKSAIGSKTVNQCFKQNEFEFYDNSTIDFGTFTESWIIEGKRTDNKGVLTGVKFSDTGKFTIQLITFTDKGCNDTVNSTIFVAPEPKAILVITDSAKCFDNHYYSMECQSIVGPNSSLTPRSDWTFSDNTTAFAKVIIGKKFPQAGTFWARLIAQTNFGCKDSVQVNLKVYGKQDATILPDKSTQCLVGNSYHFRSAKNLKESGVTVDHYWNLGDGNTSIKDSLDHIYTKEGTFKVSHYTMTSQGCADTATTDAIVVNSPKADFTLNKDTACFYSQLFNFMDKTVYSANYSVRWDFGDGTYDANKSATGKSYTATGKKQVKMVVTSDQGCKDSLVKPVEVFAVPVSGFTVNKATQCLTSNNFIFSNTSNENGANSCAYDWKIVGLQTKNYSGQNIPNQVFTDTGFHTVTLLVSSEEGCLSSSNTQIYVAEMPIAQITGRNACKGEEIQFGSAVILNKGTANFNWDFGDGLTSVQGSPKHSYMASGDFTVKLRVTSSNGCIGDAPDFPTTVFVKPTATFTSEYLLSKGVETDWKFVYTGSGADNLEWTFEDGQTDYGLAPILKTFDKTGDFKVRLIARNSAGCLDSNTQIIFLKPELLMWIPNTFSPNIDGLNESFGPNTTFGLERYEMKIFNRWGAILFQTKNPEEKWKGIDYDGVRVPEGVYGYEIVFRYVDNKLYVYKGTITVMF